MTKISCVLELEGQLYSFEREWHRSRAIVWQRDGTHFGFQTYPWILLCAVCDRIWARLHYLPLPDGYGFNTGTRLEIASCAKCGKVYNSAPIPGSIILDIDYCAIDDELVLALPEPVIRRELALHLQSKEFS